MAGLVLARTTTFDVVVPTIGRASLQTLLLALARCDGPRPARIVVADDRKRGPRPLELPAEIAASVQVVDVGGRGPAAARNAGWRRCASPWVVFLDDDVVPDPSWLLELDSDLRRCPTDAAAVQGRLTVPLPMRRRPTDYERNVAGLESAAWITADLAVRREALIDIGGFDERFRRAYREDTDLALRLMDRGWQLTRGSRHVLHPAGTSTWSTSISAQRGNADDALMRRLHGRSWRVRGQSPPGTLRSHARTSVLAMVAIVAIAVRARRLRAFAGAVTLARLTMFWSRRAAPGPRSPVAWLRLLLSSVAIPFVAPLWWAWGTIRARRVAPGGPSDRWGARPPELVLFDRDGTLIHDVPYNGEPAKVAPVDGARAALGRLRDAGVAVGVITNQSAIGHGMLTTAEVDRVNARVSELLGPFDVIQVCPHTGADDCECRKPAPGMVLQAASTLGVPPERCAVVGDIGADVGAAVAVGARGILVPNGATSPEDRVNAPEVAANLTDAVARLLDQTGVGS